MSLKVQLTSNTYAVCMTHALLNEKEEIMGLLLGNTEGLGSNRTVRIWVAVPLIRIDRRKDRTETSPEQISAVATFADRFSSVTGVQTRIVGWYHSHPHIACLPSLVDLRTQLAYQSMDENFVGLIFSCFEEDSSRNGAVRCLGFQTGVSTFNNGELFRRNVQVAIARDRHRIESALNDLVALQQKIMEEERSVFERGILGAAVSDTEHGGAAQDRIRAALSTGQGGLRAVHHLSTYHRALARIMEISAIPMLRAFEDRIAQANLRRDQYLRAAANPRPPVAPAPAPSAAAAGVSRRSASPAPQAPDAATGTGRPQSPVPGAAGRTGTPPLLSLASSSGGAEGSAHGGSGAGGAPGGGAAASAAASAHGQGQSAAGGTAARTDSGSGGPASSAASQSSVTKDFVNLLGI